MKKRICILLAMLTAAILLSCRSEGISEPVTFYYPRTVIAYNGPDGVIASEVREGAGFSSPAELVQLYLAGPADTALESPFPKDIQVLTFSSDDLGVQLIVSDHLAELTGMPLVIACNCLAKTVMELTGAPSVSIRCETLMLDGKSVIIIDHTTAIYEAAIPTESTATH